MTSRIAPYVCAALLLAAAGCKSSQPSSSANNSVPTRTADSGASAMPQAGGSSHVSPADADGIRAAIENHLRGNHGLNVDAMEMTVDSIAINGDRAQAHASFRMKNSGSTGMTMQYFLQRSGSGWVVTNGQPADGNTTLPPSTAAPSGPNSSQASQGALPDVDAFLKDHPAPKSN
ncbi:MAG TPA: hypothetical protein VNK23_00645 [Candidatus Dormibacteraeota bacterium]|nr:hypothetical protein [Candidatus Dormibacteraeota bacterium]